MGEVRRGFYTAQRHGRFRSFWRRCWIVQWDTSCRRMGCFFFRLAAEIKGFSITAFVLSVVFFLTPVPGLGLEWCCLEAMAQPDLCTKIARVDTCKSAATRTMEAPLIYHSQCTRFLFHWKFYCDPLCAICPELLNFENGTKVVNIPKIWVNMYSSLAQKQHGFWITE